MRAHEFLAENDFYALGLYDPNQDSIHQRHPTDTRKSKITLQDLHRLKIIRRARQKELEKKAKFIPVMYGSHNQETEQDLEQLNHDFKMQRAELDLMIDKAEVDQDQKDHLSKMALNALGRAKKK